MRKVISEHDLMSQRIHKPGSDSLPVLQDQQSSIDNLESISIMLHALSNKLLPIVVCSELALKRCGEDQVRTQLEKIQRSANEVRDLIAQMRQCSQREEKSNSNSFSD